MRRHAHLAALSILFTVSVALALPLAHAAKRRTYVYVHDSATNGKVFGYRLGKGGALTALPGSPFTTDEPSAGCGGQCQTMAYSKKRNVLLTTNDSGVTAWRVGKDGALAEVEGSPFAAPYAIGVAVVEVRNRAYAYVAGNPGAVTGFEIQKDGVLTTLPGMPLAVGGDLIGAAAVGTALLVMDERDGAVYSFGVARDGSLTEAETSPLDLTQEEEAYSIHTDAKGKFAVAGGYDSLFVGRLSRRTGAITSLPGGRIALPLDTYNGPAVSKKGLVAVIPFGAATSADDVQIVRLDGKSGSPSTLGGLQTLGMANVSVYAWDLRGRNLICASRENDEVRVFAVDGKAGAVAQVSQVGMPGAGDVTDIEVLQR